MKRPSDDAYAVVPAAKKSHNELSLVSDRSKQVQLSGPPRTSSLLAPIMLLTGHGGDIFCGKFHPDGTMFASAGFDRQIFLWNVHGECENYAVLPGHTGAILDLHFNIDGSMMATAGTDKIVSLWDPNTGARLKKLKGHTSFVNTCHMSRRGVQLVCSGSDDCTTRIWDARRKGECHNLNANYPITSVSFNDSAECVITGGVDNDIKVWDLRKKAVLYKLQGHSDTVTGMSLSPDGNLLLSNSMDGTLRIWDVRPYAPHDRCMKTLGGHQHNFEKNLLRCSWSPDGSKVAAGSADRLVYVWDIFSRKVLYRLPGHNGSVNDVQFHPKEPIISSVSSDKNIFLGEIEY